MKGNFVTILSIFAGLVPTTACSQKPVATERGWKTDRVIATRYHNDAMGWNVGFAFPKDANNADRVEVGDFFEAHGGWLFQGGGYPGAIAYVKFEGVDTKIKVDAKLLEILPVLNKLMADLDAGKKVTIVKPKRRILDKHGKEWPECIPPDPDDPYSAFKNNLNVNGTPYKCSIEGRWIIDDASVKAMREYDASQRQFVSDISERKMTHDELMRLTPRVNTFSGETYYAAEKYADLYDLLLRQWQLQTGHDLPFPVSLSRARGDYGRSPQESDNLHAVEQMIQTLQTMTSETGQRAVSQ